MINRNTHYIKEFGLHLKNLRKKRDLTQEQLAYDCDIPISQIGRIERGEINTTISTLYLLSKALELPTYELLKFK